MEEKIAAVKRPKIKARRPMQPQNVGSHFGRTAGDIASPLPMTEEGNKYRKNVKPYHDGLQQKLPSLHEMLQHKNRVANGRMKTCYDLKGNSVGLQPGDLVLIYNSRTKNGSCPKLSLGWQRPYTVLTRINDVVYNIVHLGRLMKYNSHTIDVSARDDQN